MVGRRDSLGKSAFDDDIFNEFVTYLATCPGDCDWCQSRDQCVRHLESLADMANRRTLNKTDLRKALDKQAFIRPPLPLENEDA